MSHSTFARPLISVVSPVYKAEAIIDPLIERLKSSLSSITENFEIILVDDCGLDNSWQRILHHCQQDKRIKGLKLSRNFGQHHAITAGLDQANGQWVVVMDCDLQDQPEEIPALYRKALEGYQVVQARRHERKDTFGKRAVSFLFNKVLSYLTGTPYDSAVANFGIYHRQVVQAVRDMRESIRFFPAMVKWVGFSATKIDVVHAPREEGESSYNLKKLFNLGLDIILSYSDKPLRSMVKFGVVIALCSFLFAFYMFVKALLGEIEVLGYASIIVSIWFLAGLTISFLGVIGLYLGKTFEGVKARPIYIVSQQKNFTAEPVEESEQLLV